MSETRTEMYQTVREALEDIAFTDSTKRGHEIILDNGISARKGINVLAALEAQEREAPNTGCDDDGSAISWALTGKTPEEIREYINRFNALTGEEAVAMVKAHRATVAKSATVQATPPAPPEAPKYAIQIPEKYDPEKSYPPAPPAAECAARKAWERLKQYRGVNWTDDNGNERTGFAYGGDPDMAAVSLRTDYEPAEYTEDMDKWIQEQCSVALASPCCEGLRAELDREVKVRQTAEKEARQHALRTEELYIERDQLRAELAAAKSEIARLTAELMLAVAWRKKAISDRTDAQTELRQAVDALRILALAGRKWDSGDIWDEASGVVRPEDALKAETIVAAYDAKHGEKS